MIVFIYIIISFFTVYIKYDEAGIFFRVMWQYSKFIVKGLNFKYRIEYMPLFSGGE